MTRRGGKARGGAKAPAGPAGGGAKPPAAVAAADAIIRPRWRRRALSLLLCLASPLVLNFAFAPYDIWPVGYVGLVPFVIGLAVAPTRRWGLFGAWLAGLVYWGTLLYWLTWITMLGYLAGILYGTLYWLVPGMLLWAALRRNQPMWLALPLVWVTFELLRAYAQDLYLGPTFPWFALAHSQYRQTVLVQISDITGYFGVSFLVAMVNGLAADGVLAMLRQRVGRSQAGAAAFPALPAPPRPGRWLAAGSAALALAAGGVMGYGVWQLSRDTRTEGPVIGIVQHAYPISLEGRSAAQEEILDAHLASTRGFLDAAVRPDLVIWPETMLPVSLNREITHLDPNSLSGDGLRCLAAKYGGSEAWDAAKYDEASLRNFLRGVLQESRSSRPSRRQLADRVYDMSGRLGCPILAGGSAAYRNDKPLFRQDEWVIRNAALWFDPNDPSAPSYAKRHLVPFSESVPFKHSWLWLHLLLRRCVPEAMDQLDPGPGNTAFTLRRPAGKWRIVSPICYEGTIAPLCRQMVYADGQKRADIMANLSNDGWFVCPWTGADRGSTEQSQHLSHYVFRAVESRVPVVRAVNTGISASIDSNGRIVARVRRGPRDTMISGTLLLDGARDASLEYLPGHGPKVLVDERVSWYSLLGDTFAIVVAVGAGTWAAGMFVFARRRRRLCN